MYKFKRQPILEDSYDLHGTARNIYEFEREQVKRGKSEMNVKRDEETDGRVRNTGRTSEREIARE